MHRSKLKNKFNKNPTKDNNRLYKKQRNYCVSLLNKNPLIMGDNVKFWQRIKPLFSDKQKSLPKEIILVENEITISNNKNVAGKLNSFFH